MEKSALGKKRKDNPQIVGVVIQKGYPEKMETPDPKTISSLVKRKAGVEVSYSTSLKGKHKAVNDMRGTPKKGYKNEFSYFYMLEKSNAGTKTSILLDGEKIFKYLFVD